MKAVTREFRKYPRRYRRRSLSLRGKVYILCRTKNPVRRVRVALSSENPLLRPSRSRSCCWPGSPWVSGVGYVIDRLAKTSPLFLIVGVFVGFAAALYAVFLETR